MLYWRKCGWHVAPLDQWYWFWNPSGWWWTSDPLRCFLSGWIRCLAFRWSCWPYRRIPLGRSSAATIVGQLALQWSGPWRISRFCQISDVHYSSGSFPCFYQSYLPVHILCVLVSLWWRDYLPLRHSLCIHSASIIGFVGALHSCTPLGGRHHFPPGWRRRSVNRWLMSTIVGR